MQETRKDLIIKKIRELVPDSNYARLGTTFETTNNKYFFDTGTGKVYMCGEAEYKILKYMVENNKLYFENDGGKSETELCDTYDQIIEIINDQHILQAPLYKEFTKLSDESLTILLEQELQQVILELTQKCNLRCKYCIYNEYNPAYRNFESRDMEWDIAKRAIDYTCIHSGKEVAVTFYGGEPLVKFDLMKKCIEYSQEIMGDKELSFSFSTNLTLMNPEIAAYIASVKNCSVLCSLDGPQVIHDSYRVKGDGTGTFEQAMRGLRYLVEAMGDSAKARIIINTVVCPPYSKEKLDMIQDFFDNLEWLPKELEKKCDYVEGGTLRDEDIAVDFLQEKNKYEKYQNNELDSIRSWALDNMLNDSDKKNYAAGINKDNLVKVHNRFLMDKPISRLGRNGCCVPGNRRIYVQVNGEFLACEKIGDSPSIGNVFTGIDRSRVKQFYLEEYDKKSIEKCSNCWAVNMCGICYATCFHKDGLDINIKNNACEYQQKQSKGELSAYYQLLEDKPEEIKKIKDIPIL